MRRPLTFLAGALALALALPAASGAERVSDGGSTAGPLDLVRLRVAQQERSVLVRFRTRRPLPRIRGLEAHPSTKASAAERFLCVSLANRAIGRRLYCPAGRARGGRIEVGVSKVSRHGVRAHGSVRARLKREKRSLALRMRIGRLGLKPGKLGFSGHSGWFGPGCRRGGKGGGAGGGRPAQRPGPAICRDEVPDRGNGHSRIYPVQRVGCGGFRQRTVFSGPRRKSVALTFDDGPGPYTGAVLRILRRFNVNATFFQIGEQVPYHASLERKILADGNELANHSMHHSMGPGRSDLKAVNNRIERATGFRPCMFRPPGGYLPSGTAAAARSLGMVNVLWNIETRDWTLPGTGAIVSRAVAAGRGSIVLMHDGGGNRSQTVAALPAIIKNLKRRGFKLKTMTELLGGRYRYRVVRKHRRADPFPDLAPPSFPVFRAGP